MYAYVRKPAHEVIFAFGFLVFFGAAGTRDSAARPIFAAGMVDFKGVLYTYKPLGAHMCVFVCWETMQAMLYRP